MLFGFKFNFKKKADLCFVSIMMFFAFILSLVFKVNLLESILMYLFIPSIYLILREKKNLKNIIIASITFGICCGMSYNFLAEYYYAYQTFYNNYFLDYKIIGNTPIADILWGFLIPFSILIFYEHFLDRENFKTINHRKKYAVITSVTLFLFSCVWIIFIDLNSSIKPFAYFIFGTLSICPLFLLFWERKIIIYKVLFIGIYFFFLNLLFEVSAVILNQWNFNGNYLYLISFKNHIVPIEELVFWIIPSSMVFVVLYEVFFDDNK